QPAKHAVHSRRPALALRRRQRGREGQGTEAPHAPVALWHSIVHRFCRLSDLARLLGRLSARPGTLPGLVVRVWERSSRAGDKAAHLRWMGYFRAPTRNAADSAGSLEATKLKFPVAAGRSNR